ncbi:hypothetical protein D3C76_661830 [compost metagenome]
MRGHLQGLGGGHADLQLAGNGGHGPHRLFAGREHAVQRITWADLFQLRVQRAG